MTKLARRSAARGRSLESTLLFAGCIGLVTACGGSGSGPAATGGTSAMDGGGSAGTDSATTGGSAGTNSAQPTGGSTTGGSDSSSGGKVVFDPDPVFPPEPAKGTPGVWEEVTSPMMDAARLRNGDGAFGIGNVVADPVHPNELYVGGQGEIWKSVDYGLTWNKLNSNPNPPALALGHVLAVAGTTPPTVWMANVRGPQFVYRSRDGGLNFELTGTIPEEPTAQSLYSIEVNPNDPTHLITGLHEEDGVLESTDSGDTWHFINGPGWIKGISWFIYFINTGDPETSRKTFFAIAQSGGSGMITRDGGKSWKVAGGLSKIEHPHGGGSMWQNKDSLFVAGIYGENGNGVYRSTDQGENWTRVSEGNSAVVWGSDKNVYTGWGWACAACDAGADGPGFKVSPMPGDAWTPVQTPDRLNWGPNSVAITTDGEKTIFVGSMWGTGMWRYIEP